MPRLKKQPDYIDTTGLTSFRYYYDAELDEMIDGDTLRLHVRLGFHAAMESLKFRLARINAPEMSLPSGEESRDHLENLIVGRPLIIKSIKTRKGWDKKGGYGRYLAEIFINDDKLSGLNVNNQLVRDNQAEWYDK